MNNKQRINLPYDPARSLLGMHPKDSTSYFIGACSTGVIAALFTVARRLETT